MELFFKIFLNSKIPGTHVSTDIVHNCLIINRVHIKHVARIESTFKTIADITLGPKCTYMYTQYSYSFNITSNPQRNLAAVAGFPRTNNMYRANELAKYTCIYIDGKYTC